MRNLFSLDEKMNVVIEPTALMLLPYKDIWSRDKSKDKKQALQELAYVYYMADYKTFFADITDEDKKHLEVVKVVFNKEYNPDVVVKNAIDFYKKDLPLSYLLLEDAKHSINTLRSYYRTTTDVDSKDAQILQNNIANLNKIIDGIEKLEMKVKKDLQLDGKLRAGREKGLFED